MPPQPGTSWVAVGFFSFTNSYFFKKKNPTNQRFGSIFPFTNFGFLGTRYFWPTPTWLGLGAPDLWLSFWVKVWRVFSWLVRLVGLKEDIDLYNAWCHPLFGLAVLCCVLFWFWEVWVFGQRVVAVFLTNIWECVWDGRFLEVCFCLKGVWRVFSLGRALTHTISSATFRL